MLPLNCHEIVFLFIGGLLNFRMTQYLFPYYIVISNFILIENCVNIK